MSIAVKLLRLFVRAVSIVDPTSDNKKFSWREALADAGIVAGFNFFYTLAGISVARITEDPYKSLIASLISAGLGFFTVLMIKRGLKPVPTPAPVKN